MISSAQPLEQKQNAPSYESALESLQIISKEESYRSNCNSDAFSSNCHGFAKIISQFLHPYKKLKPAVVNQFLTLIRSSMENDASIQSDHRLFKACALVLERYKELKEDKDEFHVSVEAKRADTLEEYSVFVAALKQEMLKLQAKETDEKFELYFFHNHVERTKEFNRPILYYYYDLLSDPSVPKDHPILERLKLALDRYPNKEQNTNLHLAILGSGPWVEPQLLSICMALMSKNIDVNAVNENGDTALHILLKERHRVERNRGPASVEAFNLLTAINFLILQPSLDLTIKDKKGRSVSDYILQREDLTLFSLRSGHLPLTTMAGENSLLSYALKNKWFDLYSYLVSEGKLNLNQQTSEFLAPLFREGERSFTSYKWIDVLLNNPQFIPFRSVSHLEAKDADSDYNSKVITEILKTKSDYMDDSMYALDRFITHSNSYAFTQDTKEFARIAKQADDNRRARVRFECMSSINLAIKAVHENAFEEARDHFAVASGKSPSTFLYYAQRLTGDLLSHKGSFSKRTNSTIA